MRTSVLWFKKDLRIIDHKPFQEASKNGNVLPLYIFEPEILESEDYDARHHQFINESLKSLKIELEKIGGYLHVEYGSVPEVFRKLNSQLLRQISIFSHEETGNWISYQRDMQLKDWCKKNNTDWIEFPQHGVQRPIKNRDGWSYEWNKSMNEPIISIPIDVEFEDHQNKFDLIKGKSLKKKVRHKKIQKGGRVNAEHLLSSFLNERGRNYAKEMSSPLTAMTSCSRLSPYISFGNISIKEVYQIAKKKRDVLKSLKGRGPWRSSISSFLGRLRWHCHFIQKLEDQPTIEWINMSRAYDNIREHDFNEEYFEAWKVGLTGYPFIDACMRCLNETGYINFRMRAMLVSFASYDLWLDWRKTSKYLATQFLDYEPGIHYSQFQMQSGVTGINSIRIYNPIKQQKDHDPEGKFVREWVPELEKIPLEYIFTPHLMSDGFQEKYSCVIGLNYPAPIIDHGLQVKKAKNILYKIKSTSEAKSEAKKIYIKHGSRRKPNQKKS